jgi:hypothetical protein
MPEFAGAETRLIETDRPFAWSDGHKGNLTIYGLKGLMMSDGPMAFDDGSIR